MNIILSLVWINYLPVWICSASSLWKSDNPRPHSYYYIKCIFAQLNTFFSFFNSFQEHLYVWRLLQLIISCIEIVFFFARSQIHRKCFNQPTRWRKQFVLVLLAGQFVRLLKSTRNYTQLTACKFSFALFLISVLIVRTGKSVPSIGSF